MEEREDVVKVKTRSDNSKVLDFYLSENVDSHSDECKDQAKVEDQSGDIQLDPDGGQSPLGEKLGDGQSPSGE